MTTLKQKWILWRRVYKYNHPLYKEWLYLKDRFKAWQGKRALNKAKTLAIERHKATGKTIYVLPDDKGIPRSFDNREIAILKRHGLMSKKATCVDLYREAMFIANYKTVQ